MAPQGPAEGSAGGHVVLGGKYALGDILGTGGTYTVYEATRVGAPDDDAPDETALLVKVLHPHLVDDETARAALAREIAASERVDHPGVVKVLDTGEDEVAGSTVLWILTRRLPGVPLSELVPDEGLPWRDGLALVGGLLDALAAVHAAGLVHRDVSPRNMVVERHDDGSATVGLLDLGLAVPAGGDGDGARVAGSVAYMSPEQAQGLPLDARSDLYSAGALAYFALTGHAPYERARLADVARAHVEAPVPAPSARQAAIPAVVDRFVARAMAKNPARRYTTAAAMGASAAVLLGTGRAVAAGGAPVTDAPGDQTLTMGQIAAEDHDRTAALGAAGALAAGAAADAELQRTRRLDAVGPVDETAELGTTELSTTDETAVAGGAVAAGAAAAGAPEAAPADPDEPRRGFLAGRGRVAAVVLALVLVAGAGAVAFVNLRGDDAAPVVPATHSPSPSPSPTPSETETDTETEEPAPPPADDPTTRPTETSTPDPTPTPSPTPSPTETPSPTPTPTPTDEPTETPTPTPTPTEEPTEEPTPTPEPTVTEEPTEDPTPTPTEESTPPVEATPTADSEDTGTTTL